MYQDKQFRATPVLRANQGAFALRAAVFAKGPGGAPAWPLAAWRAHATRLIALSVLVVAATCAAWPAHAQGMGGHGLRPGMILFGGSPEHVGRAVDHMLDGLGATDAQRAQINQIAQAAAVDLKAQREAGRGLRERGLQIFAAPNVDAAAAESVRQQMHAQQDQSGRRMLQALVDVSRVLTPEQRTKVAERIRSREAQMHDRLQRNRSERPRQ